MSAEIPATQEEEDDPRTRAYMQLLYGQNTQANVPMDLAAKAEEIKTTPLFSGQVHKSFVQGLVNNFTGDPFPQHGLLAIRQQTYNCQQGDLTGSLSMEENLVFANTNAPWSTFICGSQGAGKSHSLTCMMENSLLSASAAGVNPNPLAGMVFHYDKFTSDSSTQLCELAYLCSSGIPVRVLVSPSNFAAMHNLYTNLPGLPPGVPRPQVIPLRIREQYLNVSRMIVSRPKSPAGVLALSYPSISIQPSLSHVVTHLL